jgi:serine/threonine protein kinase
MALHRPAHAPGSPEAAAALAPTEVAPSGVRDAANGQDEDAGADSMEAARARLGSEMGGYRLDAVLGVGGTAAVYRGVRDGGEVAAIKVLHASLNALPRAKKRFLHEAAVANRLHHPSIVRMFAEGEAADGTAYLVMELAEGETLEARRAAANGRLPVEEVVRFADDILAVLAVAHAQGVVHRDVKPANLLVAPDGRLRLLDFGIARATELSETPSLVTRSGAVLGTVFFMAPEQALGIREEVDARSDVWAVGATMFTLISGQFVHRARTVNEALALAATQSAPPIHSVSPGLDSALATVVNRALSFDRNARYAHAGAMREALHRAMRGEGEDQGLATAETLPETETLPERSMAIPPGKPGNRPRRLWLAASIVIIFVPSLLAVGQMTGAVRLWAPAPSVTAPVEPEPPMTAADPAIAPTVPPSSAAPIGAAPPKEPAAAMPAPPAMASAGAGPQATSPPQAPSTAIKRHVAPSPAKPSSAPASTSSRPLIPKVPATSSEGFY